jgi:hypothetical protein
MNSGKSFNFINQWKPEADFFSSRINPHSQDGARPGFFKVGSRGMREEELPAPIVPEGFIVHVAVKNRF